MTMALLGGIVESLEHKTILVTGCTGFLGKVFVEKVLRVQPHVKRIFLLLRAADDATATQRFQNEVLGKEIFKVLREIHGVDFDSFIWDKVYPVAGDISYENLGIKDPNTSEMVYKEIDIIVNSAAITKFDERYDIALNTNTLGAKHVLEFAKKCVKLQVLLHVSTAYVAGEKEGLILEKPFQMNQALNEKLTLDIEAEVILVHNKLKELHMKGANETAQRTAMKEMGLERARLFGWPNTYTFTKAMGEMLLGHLKNVPLVIVRPAIVSSTWKDPFPGWIEGIRTIDSVIVSYAKGKLKCFLADPMSPMDVIPVDVVVNAMIISITAHSSQPSQFIYQLGSSVRNPVYYSHLLDCCYRYFTRNPLISEDGKPIKYHICPLLSTRSSFSRYMTLHYKIPIQGLRVANGALCQLFHTRYSQVNRKYKQVMRMARLYEPYVFFKGRFDDSNSEGFRVAMKGEGVEAKMFQLDPKCINWEDYFFKVHFPGVAKYLIK